MRYLFSVERSRIRAFDAVCRAFYTQSRCHPGREVGGGASDVLGAYSEYVAGYPKCVKFRIDLVAVCLWGNSTDLSLLINMTEEQIKSLQSTGGAHLAATEKNILGNHMKGLWETVVNLRANTGGRVDFVLDNAGFELYCDCVYGTCLGWHTARIVPDRSGLVHSRFPHSERPCEGGSLPRQALSLVRVGRDQEGLGLAVEHDGVRSPVPEGV